VPGGFNALQRIYRELEEPMLNATREQFTQNPFSALLNNSNSSNENRQAGTENTEPLPNPWGSRPAPSTNSTSTTTTSSSTTPSAANVPNMNNIFSQLLTGSTPPSASTSSTTSSTTTTTSSSTTPNPNPLLAGLGGPGVVQDYMQQMLQNPRQLESIMSTPHMQSMLQMISSNPEMSRLLVDSNPQLAANPELRDQVTRSLPAMMQQVNTTVKFQNLTDLI